MYLKVWQRHFTSFFSLLLYIYMYILFPVCIFLFIQFTGRASISIIIIFRKKMLNVINFKNIMPQDTSIEGRRDSLIRLILRVYFFLFLFLRFSNLCTFYYFIYCHLPFWFFPISLIQRVGERNSYM